MNINESTDVLSWGRRMARASWLGKYLSLHASLACIGTICRWIQMFEGIDWMNPDVNLYNTRIAFVVLAPLPRGFDINLHTFEKSYFTRGGTWFNCISKEESCRSFRWPIINADKQESLHANVPFLTASFLRLVSAIWCWLRVTSISPPKIASLTRLVLLTIGMANTNSPSFFFLSQAVFHLYYGGVSTSKRRRNKKQGEQSITVKGGWVVHTSDA